MKHGDMILLRKSIDDFGIWNIHLAPYRVRTKVDSVPSLKTASLSWRHLSPACNNLTISNIVSIHAHHLNPITNVKDWLGVGVRE